MKTRRGFVTVIAAGALVGIGWILGQSGPALNAATALTGSDIAEIEQLYARYNQGLDFRDQELLLSAFADDAVYTTGGGEAHEGKAAIAAWSAPLLEAGPTTITHNNTSIVITPTDGGARGRGYWILFNVEQQPPAPMMTGYYEDTFVKTANGWRIKTRSSVRGWSAAASQ